jgi:hypothetical protein
MTVKQVGTYVKTVTYDSIPAGKTVTGLCSNDSGTYCAILNDGSIYMWGEFSAPVLPDNIKIVKSFGQPNTTNFLLLTNNRRLYRINGNTDHGYGSIEGYEVEKLCYVDTLPSIIYTNGTTNFNGIPAGLIPAGLGIKDIVRCGSSEYIYIALLTNNTVVTWKNYTTSPSITNLNTALLAGKTVTGIYADSYVAVVACSDNTIVSCQTL